MNPRILVIEDDNRLAGMVCDYLGDNGYSCTHAADGASGIDQQIDNNFDAIVLDLMLPDIGGLEVCRTIRAHDNVPILMLTAKGDPMDRVIGLEIGADDYLPKPFEPRELLARLRAILRRGKAGAPAQMMQFGRLKINEDAMCAFLDEARCDLTTHQFSLLCLLAKAPGRVLSRDHLMDQLKGIDLDVFDRSIDVHISRIRAAIEDDPKLPKRIITVRGAGYVFAREQN